MTISSMNSPCMYHSHAWLSCSNIYARKHSHNKKFFFMHEHKSHNYLMDWWRLK
jgi:hypothetical protein